MTTYGKLVDGLITYYNPTKGLPIDMGMTIFNPSVERLNKYGYYEVKEVNEVGTDKVEDGYLLHYVGHEKTVQEAKEEVIGKISVYDESSAVNEFSINGEKMWIARDLRESLSSTLANEIAIGSEEFTQWYNNKAYTFKTSDWEDMLSALNHYAYQCYCNTQQHIRNVNELTSVDAIEAYDYTTGYPTKPTFVR